ncbi:hypothetical protein OAS39_04365 [Pirellulales bacterium]|nr:hypothetical protein [Pirellulales bacterium]
MIGAARTTHIAVIGLFHLFAGAALLTAAEDFHIERVSPRALRPGHTTQLTVSGPGMEGAAGLWAAFDESLGPPLATADGQAVFEITLPEDSPVGITALRVVTDEQMSNLALLAIDDLPTLAEQRKNSSRKAAPELRLPVAAAGTIGSTESRWFRFSGHQGDRVAVDVLAARLGSPLDPLVLVTSADGALVAHSDDDPAQGGDCRLACVLPADGEYYLELRDAGYQGGAGYFFHLRIGNFPLVRSVFPLAVRHGEQVLLEVTDDGSSMQIARLTAPQTGNLAWFGIRTPAADSATFGGVLLSNLEESVELVGNDAREQAQHLSIPSAVSGRFEQVHDRDWYSASVAAGQEIWIAPRHATLGVATRIFMRLYDSAGGKLAQSAQTGAQTGAQAGAIYYRSEEAQTLFLEVQELHRRHGPNQVYRLEFLEGRYDFALTVGSDRFRAPHSGVLVVNVTAQRQGYRGPIELSVDGLEGAQLENNVFGQIEGEATENGETVELRILLPGNLSVGARERFRIVGRAPQDDEFSYRGVAVELLTSPARSFSTVDFPARELRESLSVNVGPPFPSFFQLAIGPRPLRIAPGTDRLTIEVSADRSNGFEGPIEFGMLGLPEQAKLRGDKIAGEQSAKVAQLRGLASLSAGVYPLRLRGSAAFENQPQDFTSEERLLRVGPALEIEAEAAGPLTPGEVQQLRLHVRRFTDDRGPIEFALGNAPDGVRLLEPATIAGDQVEAELQLAVDVDAAPADDCEVKLVATTKIDPPLPFAVAGRSLGAELPQEELEEIGVLREAESFDRGNAIIDHERYGKGIGVISDPGGQQNFAEYDIELAEAGMYQVELRYAAAQSRPGQLSINGQVVKDDAISQVSGGWLPANQQWVVEGVFSFRQGKNVLRLQSEPMMSHIDKVLVAPARLSQALEATFDSWVSQDSEATAKSRDGNLVSVFASDNSVTGKWRVGVVEFDVSDLAGRRIESAHLELAVDGRDSRLAKGPVHVQTRLLPSRVDAAELTGVSYPDLAGDSLVCERLGRFIIEEAGSGPPGSWDKSAQAAPGDLELLNQRMNAGQTKLVIVLESLEDGSATARDWGANDKGPRGTHGGPLPPRLVVGVASDQAEEPEIVTVESKSVPLRIVSASE